MIKIIQKIIMILIGMPYLYFISIASLVMGLELCINNPNFLKDYNSINNSNFLKDFNNLLNKNIDILRNAWREIGGIQ